LDDVNIPWEQWRSQPKIFLGAKMFDFRRITLFCLEKRLSQHKMTIFSKSWGGIAPLPPTGYAYAWEFNNRADFVSQSITGFKWILGYSVSL